MSQVKIENRVGPIGTSISIKIKFVGFIKIDMSLKLSALNVKLILLRFAEGQINSYYLC